MSEFVLCLKYLIVVFCNVCRDSICILSNLQEFKLFNSLKFLNFYLNVERFVSFLYFHVIRSQLAMLLPPSQAGATLLYNHLFALFGDVSLVPPYLVSRNPPRSFSSFAAIKSCLLLGSLLCCRNQIQSPSRISPLLSACGNLQLILLVLSYPHSSHVVSSKNNAWKWC